MIQFYPIEAVSLGPVQIYTHGFFMALGVAIGLIAARYSLAKSKKLNTDILITGGILATIGGLFGARIAYVLLNLQNPWSLWDLLAIWSGGLVSFGGIIGGLLVSILYLLYKKQRLWQWLDFVAPYVFLGWGIGRIGDLVSWGEIGTQTNLPWGFVVNGDVPRHPAQLYETVLLVTAFFVLRQLQKRHPLRTGTLSCIALIVYGTLRFAIEFVRDYPNSEYLFSYQAFAQGVSLAFVILGTIIYCFLSKRHKHE